MHHKYLNRITTLLTFHPLPRQTRSTKICTQLTGYMWITMQYVGLPLFEIFRDSIKRFFSSR